MRITASDVAHITGGHLVGPDCVADGVSYDSRQIAPGQMFVAVTAERDGNDFINSAREAGASCALVSAGRALPGMTCIEVEDTTASLGVLGRSVRRQLQHQLGQRVAGITGSAGKTSTKNLVRAVLSQGFTTVHAAEHSLNNDIGVPVTILNSPDNVDALVLEMGMRGFHEIERLCGIAEPVIGVVTNIGDAHGERVGGAAGIAQAKGELIESLPVDGTAILNGDDVWLKALVSRASCPVVTFGQTQECDLVWSVESIDDSGVVTASFSFAGEACVVTPALPGVHMVANAAAAVLVGISCGMTFAQATSGIGKERAESGRMVWMSLDSGQRILDDSYNANESSMMAALRVLASASGNEKIAVLGRMAEVSDEKSAHENVASFARQVGVRLLALETDLYGCDSMSVDEVIAELHKSSWECLLVKGSRASATERVIHRLLNH